MSHSIFAVANTLVRLSPGLTAMQVQRLLYIAQAKSLQAGWRLHDDVAVRWPTGPVVPALYHKYRAFGSDPVTRSIMVSGGGIPVVPDDGHLVRSMLHGVLAEFGAVPLDKINAMLMRPNSAWSLTQESYPISDERMRTEKFNVAKL